MQIICVQRCVLKCLLVSTSGLFTGVAIAVGPILISSTYGASCAILEVLSTDAFDVNVELLPNEIMSYVNENRIFSLGNIERIYLAREEKPDATSHPPKSVL
jgi:hypothetical protein